MNDLIVDVASSDARRAHAAVKLLIKRRDAACMPDLLPLALNGDIEIQSRAVMVLSHFAETQHRAIWKFMEPLLLKGTRSQKVAALLALEDLPVTEAVPVLKRFAARAQDTEIRARSVACLAAIARVKPKLRPSLRWHFEKAASSRAAFLRMAGLEGLNALRDSRFNCILLDTRIDADPGIRARYVTYAQAIRARKRS